MKITDNIKSHALSAQWALTAPDHWKFAERHYVKDMCNKDRQVSKAAEAGKPSAFTIAEAERLGHCLGCVRGAYKALADGAKEAGLVPHRGTEN